MSNSGQALLSIAGAAVGFIVTGGNPAGAIYGFQLGYLAGTALFPTQLPHMQGPRLGEGQQTVSIVGQPIPMIFGTQAVGGNVIWASPIREVANTETQGGKGGPEQSQTTYSYYRSWALLLCEGPIGGVRRVWANGKLVYDATALASSEEPDPVPDGSGLTNDLAEAIQRSALNEQLGLKMTVYLGTEDQLPDPVIESFEGAGNVPGFRGYAYLVFDDVELKPEDGLRIPSSWKVEVFEEGLGTNTDASQYSNEIMFPWPSNAELRIDPRNTDNVHEYQLAGVSNTGVDEGAGPWRSSLSSALGDMSSLYGQSGPSESDLIGWSIRETADGWTSNLRPIRTDALPWDRGFVFLHFNEAAFGGQFLGFYPQLSYINIIAGDCAATIFSGGLEPFGGGALWWGDRYSGHPDPAQNVLDNQYEIGVYTWNAYPEGASGRQVFNNNCVDSNPLIFVPNDQALIMTPDVIVKTRRVPQPPPDPAVAGVPVVGLENWYVWQGSILRGGAWEEVAGTFHVLQSYTATGTPTIVTLPLNPCIPSGHPLYDNQAYWEEHYAAAVAQGLMEAGLVYGVDYPATQAFAYKKTNDLDTVETTPVSLASIVSRLCDRAGENADFDSYDVSDLENEYVIGYQVARPMAARAAIEPLRSIGFFDVVESGTQLKFVTRGKPAVAQLSSDDIGCFLSEEARPPAITTRKKQEFEMPRQLRIHFQNPERDYEPGEELSPPRFDTKAESVLDIDVAAAITPTKAAQIAEVLYRDIWAGRWTHTTQVDQSWSFLEPADCITVPIDGRAERVRIPAITERLPNLRALELIRDDDGTYQSEAIGTTPQHTPTGIELYGPVELELLDLPPLSSDHDDAGIYATVRPYVRQGALRGAVISRSNDGGNYQTIGSLTSAAPMGYVRVPLPAGPTTIFDEGNELIVELMNGELESRTQSDVLGGANAAVIGDHGRWEILQFKNAEFVGVSIWRLTGLLRGRRGTEHAVGSSAEGDRFILISSGALARLSLAVSELDLQMLYKATPIGHSPEGVPYEAFTAAGVALKPFAPVHVRAVQDPQGEYVISWTRRDRLADSDGLTVPMSESVEDWEIDILDEDGEVRRTISVSASPATYTLEQQLNDFGEVRREVPLRVYQISSAVGRGYPSSSVKYVTLGNSLDLSAAPYLEYIKGPYPNASAPPTLEFRAVFEGDNYVDVQQNSAGTAWTLRAYNDADEQTGSFGIFELIDAIKIAEGYIVIAARNGGLGVGSSAGIVRRIDVDSMIPGGVVADSTTHSASVGTAGDPSSLALIGSTLYVACPFDGTIEVRSAADLSLLGTLVPEFPAWTLMVNGSDLWALERHNDPGQSKAFQINTSDGSTVTSFAVLDFPLDGVIANGSLYVISGQEAKFARYNLSGDLIGYPLNVEGESFASAENYLTLEGNLLSVGRDVITVLEV